MLKQKKILFFFIVLLAIAFVLRCYKVGSAPSGALIDEASFGYNAYSILKTGKDEHGVSFPLVFKAFGDQKLPAYAYALLPLIKLFGLNNTAIRLPSVIAGTILSGVLYLLLIETGFSLPVSFIGGLITATSPWSIILGRFGYESHFGLLFFVLALLLTFRAYRKKSIVVSIFAGLCYGITLYSYVAFKLITPLTLLCILIINRSAKKQKKNIRAVVFASFVVSIIPILITVFSEQTTARFAQLSQTYQSGLKMEIDENRAFCGTRLPQLLCYASSNKPLFYMRTYLHRYVSTLSPSYLFLDGDVDVTYVNVNHFGSFYVWLLPFYFLGLVYLWKKIENHTLTPFEKTLILIFLISPLPAILVGEPQKIRISAFFPFATLVIVCGIAQIETKLKKPFQKYLLYVSLIVMSCVSVTYLMIHYLTIQINKYETAYGTYVPKLMRYLAKQDKKTHIYIRSITEGITLYAYYNAIDPAVFQQKSVFQKPDAIGFAHVKDFENIHITEQDMFGIACKTKQMNKSALFVSSENDRSIPDSSKKIIYSENGVDTLSIIYDLTKITFNYALCQKK